jgi:hypothetical protein
MMRSVCERLNPGASMGPIGWELRLTAIDDRGPKRDAKSVGTIEQSRCRNPVETNAQRASVDAARMTNEAIDCQNDSQSLAASDVHFL